MPAFRADATPVQAWPRPVNDDEPRSTRIVLERSACGYPRRAAVRLFAVCALAGPAALRSQAARAVKGWCRRDPIVKIGDLTVDIGLFSAVEMHELATGPTQLVIGVPAGIATRFVADDPGFGHFGYDVRFAESHDLSADDRSVDVRLEAYAPAANPPDGPLPLLLEFAPRGDGRPATVQAEGRANEWVSLRASLAAVDFAAPPLSPEDASDDARDAEKKDKQGRGKKKS